MDTCAHVYHAWQVLHWCILYTHACIQLNTDHFHLCRNGDGTIMQCEQRAFWNWQNRMGMFGQVGHS